MRRRWFSAIAVLLGFAAPMLPGAIGQEPTAPPAAALPELPDTRVIGQRAPVAGAPIDAAPLSPLAFPNVQSQSTPAPFTTSGGLGLGSDLIGKTFSSSSGFISQKDLQFRPYVRTGEILEAIPGFLALQHSGGGKAAQFVLRGVTMDHGTDFALFVDGQPVNLPSHCHGQGYLDYNYVIPELIDTVHYRKGPYWGDVGDFDTTGTAAMRLATKLNEGFLKIESGMYGYTRTVVADSFDVGGGTFIYGLEGRTADTAFLPPESLRRFAGYMKYSVGDEEAGFNVAATSYYAHWLATDQQPIEAMNLGLIDRFSTLDPTTGGQTYRHGMTAEAWVKHDNNSVTRANFYATAYHLNLFFNGVEYVGDLSGQVRQEEYRTVLGGGVNHTINWDFGNDRKMSHTFGLQTRNDNLPQSRLSSTDARIYQPFVSPVGVPSAGYITDDAINQTYLSLFYINDFQPVDKVRTMAALRWDHYWFDVENKFDANSPTGLAPSGNVNSNFVAPKAAIVFGPFHDTEFFGNFGLGFHSNDARAVVGRYDDAGVLQQAPGLVRAIGYEVGVRNDGFIPRLKTAMTLFYLELNSELVFAGDAGTTEARGKTRRYGFEYTGYYNITDWWSLDSEFTAVHARFAELQEADSGGFGTYIPQSVPFVLSGGTSFKAPGGFFASLRLRSFSSQPLTEDNAFRSEQTILFNSIVGYQRNRFTVGAEWINMFNAQAPDVSYAYPYQLARGGATQVGPLIRATEPIQARFFLSYTF